MLKQHRFLIPGILLLLILFSVASGWWLSLPRGDELPASIRIVPSAQETSGVVTSAVFQLTSGFSVKDEALRTMLELDPPINYTLSGGGKEWTLQPVMPLRENTVYTFRVMSQTGTPVQSFAFQTRSDLLVSDVYPGDGAAYVDVDTGIEIRFNRPGVDLSRGFSILPPVSGRFESQEYACRFIPDRPLEYNSIYRVTLKDLQSRDGASLLEPFTFTFETAEQEGAESWDDLTVDDFTVSYLPGDAMRVALRGGERQASATYTMTLHKYPGINVYADVLRERGAFYREQYGVKEQYQAKTEGLDEIVRTEGRLLEEDGVLYAPLPDGLSEGYYLFTLSGEGADKEQFVQQLIQVVNLSLYTQSAGGETLFWLGDPVSGGPAAGATVELETESGGRVSGQAGENGLVTLRTGDSTRGYVTVVRAGTPVWFSEPALSAEETEHPLSRDYYAALYTDREIYLPGDAIHFWGVVKPRQDAPMPETLRVSLSNVWPRSVLSGVEVPVRDGVFTGVLQPGALLADGYLLTVGDGGDGVYVERSLSISEYEKPAYRITLSTDREIYHYGDTVHFSVSVQYYDGTPAAGARMVADCYEAHLDGMPFTLDEQGQATFTGVLDPAAIQPGEGRVAGWEPQYTGWSVRSADEQAANLSQWASFLSLPSKIAAEMTYEAGGTLSVAAAVLDETKVAQPSDPGEGRSDFERLRGVPADIPMTLVVHKVTNRQIQTGSWYDYVNKQNVPVYETKYEETVERNIPVTTAAGRAQVTELPAAESDDVSYWYELRFAGGVYGDVCAVTYPVSPYRRYSAPEYTFFANGEEQKAVPGDVLELGVWKDAERVENARFLYTLVQDRMLEQEVAAQAATLTMDEAWLPNVWLAGAYFDGRAMHGMQPANLVFDYSGRTLTVQAQPDKEAYRPGEEMQVTIKLFDAQGTAVAGKAAVGVVDEAVFDLAEQRVELAAQLYRSIYYPNIVNTASQEAADAAAPKAAADSGGRALMAGGGILRAEFRDTADFAAVDVPAEGITVPVKLPDNVTSWRVTAAAVTKDLQAGDTLSNSAATLPFYLRPIVTGTYLTGDDVTVSALAVGTALTDGNAVRYTAVLADAQGRETKLEQEVPAGGRAAFRFGKQTAGDYRVTLSAECGEYRDAMALPLCVAETSLLVPSLETVELASLSAVESAAWPVDVTVVDAASKPAFDTLAWLSSRHGRRTEQVAASARAMELFNELRPVSLREILPRDKRLDGIQVEGGGIAPLPASGGDAALTAKLLLAAPELLHQGQAVAFLHDVLKDPAANMDDRVMAYVGLAAAKEPVLLDLQRLYEQEGTQMKPYLRLYVGAAFARLGDFERAGQIYDTVKLVRSGDMAHVDDSDVRATAAALLLAAESGRAEEAAALANDLMKRNWDGGKEGALPDLELLYYAKHAAGQAGEGRFSYDDNGKIREVTLENGMAFLRLDGPALHNGKFRALSGRLTAAVRVLRPGEGEAGGSFATVTKTYEPVGGTLSPGGQVKVKVTVKFSDDAPYGAYTLTDAIPSGLRWVDGGRTVSPRDGSIWPSLSQDGQRINGVLYRTKPDGGGDGPIPLSAVPGVSARWLAQTAEAAPSVTDDASSADVSEEESVPEPQGEEAGSQAEENPDFAAEPDASASQDLEEMEAEQELSAEEEPVADRAGNSRYNAGEPNLNDAKPQQPEDPNTFVFTYTLSAVLPGSFVTESAWIGWEDEAVKSERGVIAVAD